LKVKVMTSLDERIASLFRKAPPVGDADHAPLLAHPVADEPLSEAVASEPTSEGTHATRVEDPVSLAPQETMAAQAPSPLAGLDLDTAIRLRWALRDIKAKRTKLTPVSPDDLKTLTELGLVVTGDDAPMLTNEGHQSLDQ
jgi:hypothetical protein